MSEIECLILNATGATILVYYSHSIVPVSWDTIEKVFYQMARKVVLLQSYLQQNYYEYLIKWVPCAKYLKSLAEWVIYIVNIKFNNSNIYFRYF